MDNPTPAERQAVDAVSRLGQEHSTAEPLDRAVLKAIRDARRQGVAGRLRVSAAELERGDTDAR